MTIVELKAQFMAAPHRCPACDVEWQDHKGVGPVCMEREQLYEALERVLPFCRPPVDKGLEENVEYLRRVSRAKKLLEELA